VAEAWHRAEGRFDKVDALLDREIALEPDARKQAHLYLERHNVRRDWLSDMAGAKKMLQAALEIDPGHERALDALRADAQRDGSWGPLRAALFRAAEASPDRPRAVLFLKEIATLDLERFSDPRAAEASIDRALEANPNDPDALLFKARLMVRAGSVDGVPAILERAERAGAKELPGLLNVVRGDGLLISGDREGARRAFFAATKDKETSARAWDRLIDLADGTPQAVLCWRRRAAPPMTRSAS
jgi:tetratricopeptide (TPR) repeat protein